MIREKLGGARPESVDGGAGWWLKRTTVRLNRAVVCVWYWIVQRHDDEWTTFGRNI